VQRNNFIEPLKTDPCTNPVCYSKMDHCGLQSPNLSPLPQINDWSDHSGHLVCWCMYLINSVGRWVFIVHKRAIQVP